MYSSKYINIIKTTNLPTWKLYEYLVAIKLNMMVWSDAINHLKNIPFNADYGIDLVSYDLKKTAQVKYYGEQSTITWKSVSTYISYSREILGISDMMIVTTPYAKIQKIVKNSIPIVELDINKINTINVTPTINSLFNLFSIIDKKL